MTTLVIVVAIGRVPSVVHRLLTTVLLAIVVFGVTAWPTDARPRILSLAFRLEGGPSTASVLRFGRLLSLSIGSTSAAEPLSPKAVKMRILANELFRCKASQSLWFLGEAELCVRLGLTHGCGIMVAHHGGQGRDLHQGSSLRQGSAVASESA